MTNEGVRASGCLPRSAPTVLNVPRGDAALLIPPKLAATIAGPPSLMLGSCAGGKHARLDARLGASPCTVLMEAPDRAGDWPPPLAFAWKVCGSGVTGAVL